jgi:hypothetical protein
MTVRYHLRGPTTQPEYVCARQVTDYGHGERCQALAGACVDALVTEQVLAALAPAAVARSSPGSPGSVALTVSRIGPAAKRNRRGNGRTSLAANPALAGCPGSAGRPACAIVRDRVTSCPGSAPARPGGRR